MDDRISRIGNNYIMCKGYLVLGKRFYNMIFSFLLISLPMGLFIFGAVCVNKIFNNLFTTVGKFKTKFTFKLDNSQYNPIHNLLYFSSPRRTNRSRNIRKTTQCILYY
jgi:hypothetical protein